MSCRDPFLALRREKCVVRPDDDIDGGPHFMIRSNDGSVDVEQKKIWTRVLLLYQGSVQSWAKEWSLSCVNPASRLLLAVGGEFTQPRDHSSAQLFISFLTQED